MATPRSKRLGRELRRLRDAVKPKALTLDQVAAALRCSPSRVQRIEAGEIKVRRGDVLEMLEVYGLSPTEEPGRTLVAMTEGLKDQGWWQRLGTLTQRYVTLIAFEAEATQILWYEPTLVPGLLQTEEYARAVIGAGWDLDDEQIEERVSARIRRQEVLTRDKRPLRLWVVISEGVLMCEVGGADVLKKQLEHLVKMSEQPNVQIQVLRFSAGAHLADSGGFEILSFERGDPDLGYVETVAGELFIEGPQDLQRLRTVHQHLQTLALSPAESVQLISERIG